MLHEYKIDWDIELYGFTCFMSREKEKPKTDVYWSRQLMVFFYLLTWFGEID